MVQDHNCSNPEVKIEAGQIPRNSCGISQTSIFLGVLCVISRDEYLECLIHCDLLNNIIYIYIYQCIVWYILVWYYLFFMICVLIVIYVYIQHPWYDIFIATLFVNKEQHVFTSSIFWGYNWCILRCFLNTLFIYIYILVFDVWYLADDITLYIHTHVLSLCFCASAMFWFNHLSSV